MPPRRSSAKSKSEPGTSAGERSQGLQQSAQLHRTERPCPIVGIGASAGGLETYTQLLSHLPPDTGMAFVLVQHLDPKHASMLSELLSRATPMPVTEVKDGMPIEPNHVYVIPPNTNMAVFHGNLSLMPRTETRGQHLPVDYFLRSLAEDQGSKAVGVILSGTASDGAQGLKAIKSEGGITFAQDPETAKYSGMPRAAIAADVVDFILPPEAIAEELSRIGRHPYVIRPKAVDTGELLPESEGDLLTKIFILLRRASGVDFTYYKRSTIKRRIARRMVVYKMEKLDDYVRFLHGNPAELDALYEDMLISVTGFFRDPETFEFLKSAVFSEIRKRKPAEAPIRVWIPGCSTGEEAYSIAISLLEFLEDVPAKPPIQIFATDINEKAIEKARSGIYSESIADDVSPERLRRFFVQSGSGYQISKAIRDMCVFAKHDVTRDPPFSKLDLISCRNVLIYLGSILQKRVMPIFHYALQNTGYLVLGPSESIGGFSDLFVPADRKHKIYARKAATTRLPVDFVPTEYPLEKLEAGRRPSKSVVEVGESFDAQKEADRVVLTRYAPSGVVINDEMDILQFRGRTGHYLEPSPGRASLNLLTMAKEGLALELRTAVHKARKSDGPVRSEGLRVRHDDELRDVNIEAVPLKAPAGERYFLILFEEVARPGLPPSAAKVAPGEVKQAGTPLTAEEREMLALKRELEETREYLRSMMEEKEAANEELRAANEEIQSANEELQSINEELETAKEELQSSNEELTTVNEELQNRNVELAQLNNDLSNLLSSVNLPIIMLDSDLRIRRFTSSADEVFGVIPADIGRPIGDIKVKIGVPGLEDMILKVIDTVTPVEREIRDQDGRWLSMWIRPYKTAENRIDGAVITLMDIDALKLSLERIQESGRLSESLNEISSAVSSTLDFEEIMRRVVAEAGKAIGVEAAVIVLREDNEWMVRYLYGLPEEVVGTRFTDEEVPHIALAARSKERVVINDTLNDERVNRATMERFGVRSVLTVPLKAKGDVIGVLGFNYHSAPIPFTEVQMDFAGKLALAVSLAVENARLYALQRNLAEHLDRVVETVAEGIVTVDQEGRIASLNAAAEGILGVSRGEVVGQIYPAWKVIGLDGKLLPSEKLTCLNVLKTAEPAYGKEYAVDRRDGTRVIVAVNANPLLDQAGNCVGAVTSFADITERKHIEQERQRAKELSEALNDIGAAMGSTLDFSEILRIAATDSCRAIGSESAAVTLRDGDRWVTRAVHGMPEQVLGRALTDDEAEAATLAFRTGQLVVSNDAYNDKRLHRELMERHELRSLLAVPVVLRGDIAGVLTFQYHTAPVAFTEEQIDFARKMASILSFALENARLYGAQKSIADILQESLLTVPREIEGIEFGHLYRSASEAALVGGDFYDLFELGRDRVGIIVGDVSGKGVEAATFSAFIRHSIKAYAHQVDSPAEVMALTSDLAEKMSPISVFVTVFFGVLDKKSGGLVYCSAGHPPAILRKSSSVMTLLTVGSPAIGTFPLDYLDGRATLEGRDILFVYTDGLTEARGDHELFGEERLVELVTGLEDARVQQLPERVVAEVVTYAGGKLSDDIAILAISLAGSSG